MFKIYSLVQWWNDNRTWKEMGNKIKEIALYIDAKSNERWQRYKMKFILLGNKQGFKKHSGIKKEFEKWHSPLIKTEKILIMQEKCTKYFYSTFVERNKRTIWCKGEEAVSILIASSEDVETYNKQF